MSFSEDSYNAMRKYLSDFLDQVRKAALDTVRGVQSDKTKEIIDGTIGLEEAQRRNEELKREVQGQMSTFWEKVVESAVVRPDDPPIVADIKQAIAKQVVSWMSSLLQEFLVAAHKVYECFKKGVKWCYEKMKDLFSWLIGKVESYF